MGNKVSLEDEMVNLRIVSKQMQRSAKKCEKNEKASLDKLKKVSHGGAIVSRSHAENGSNKAFLGMFDQ
jgi:charged multivesicular body protein 1